MKKLVYEASSWNQSGASFHITQPQAKKTNNFDSAKTILFGFFFGQKGVYILTTKFCIRSELTQCAHLIVPEGSLRLESIFSDHCSHHSIGLCAKNFFLYLAF